MDLSKIRARDSIKVEIDHPACEGVVFELAGPNHPITLKCQQERNAELGQMRKRPTREEKEAWVLGTIADRILGWEGVEWDGKPLEFTRAAAVNLLGNPNLSFVRDQLLAALRGDEDFFGV